MAFLNVSIDCDVVVSATWDGGADLDGGAEPVSGDVPRGAASSALDEANVLNEQCSIDALRQLYLLATED